MQYARSGETFVLKVERGETLIGSVTLFCQEQGIENAYFSGIGAVDKLTCGYYNLEEQEYHFTEYKEPLEVASLIGNVMQKEDEPFVHVHGIFTNTKNEALGGHVKDARVGVTLEIMLTPLSSSLERELDKDIGLALINCPNT